MTQDLSNRTILRVSGSDATRYINGQVSQDVNLASDEVAVYSIVASFKGKIQGDFYLRTYQGDLLIDTTPSQSESLIARLDKYLIADDAEIEDISDLYNLYHVLGEQDVDPSKASWECDRYGQTGRDYLLPTSENLPPATKDDEWKKLRISNKIPSWGDELDEDTLPPEAGIESRAISYTKGCYTGQEVISRMKSAGKTNRHLVAFNFKKSTETPLNLYHEKNFEGKPGATITSICKTESNGWIGLGYRTRKCESIEVFYDKEENTYSVSNS